MDLGKANSFQKPQFRERIFKVPFTAKIQNLKCGLWVPSRFIYCILIQPQVLYLSYKQWRLGSTKNHHFSDEVMTCINFKMKFKLLRHLIRTGNLCSLRLPSDETVIYLECFPTPS